MSVFSKSINQWCYGADRSGLLPNNVAIGGKPCWYSAGMEMQRSVSGAKEVVVLGTCIPVSEDAGAAGVADMLSSLSFEDFLRATECLLGVYVIFRVDGNGLKIFGDASHLLGVYYGVGEKSRGVVASCEALIVGGGEEISEEAKDVVRGAYSSGLYLAGDMTMYSSVKCLMANHYLDVESNKPVRCFPRENIRMAASEAEIDGIIEKTFRMVGRGIVGLAGKYSMALPLTPGGDSRVNCALVKAFLPDADVFFYVIKNIELQRESDNIAFIRELAGKLGITDFHILGEEDFIDEATVCELRRECGDIRGWGRRLWCYNSALGGRAIVKGELIDQIGKSPYGRAMPEWMATKFFLKTILSNTSRTADVEFSKWYDEAKDNCRGYSMFDLYSWEVRCGRWNSNTQSIQNILGVENLNFFNCTGILAEWCRIPRRYRKDKWIHRRFMEMTCPAVARMPVNPYAYRHSRHLAPFLSRVVPYWCRWIAQYWMHKFGLGK